MKTGGTLLFIICLASVCYAAGIPALEIPKVLDLPRIPTEPVDAAQVYRAPHLPESDSSAAGTAELGIADRIPPGPLHDETRAVSETIAKAQQEALKNPGQGGATTHGSRADKIAEALESLANKHPFRAFPNALEHYLNGSNVSNVLYLYLKSYFPNDSAMQKVTTLWVNARAKYGDNFRVPEFRSEDSPAALNQAEQNALPFTLRFSKGLGEVDMVVILRQLANTEELASKYLSVNNDSATAEHIHGKIEELIGVIADYQALYTKSGRQLNHLQSFLKEKDSVWDVNDPKFKDALSIYKKFYERTANYQNKVVELLISLAQVRKAYSLQPKSGNPFIGSFGSHKPLGN